MNPAVIIPVYNHPYEIAEVVDRACRLGLPVYVVDDGSTDSTAATLKTLTGVTILRHEINCGKGAAIRTGFAAARGNNHDFAITLDGDGQHNPENARELLHAAGDGRRCIVIGCRQGMEDDENVPWTSRFGRQFSNFWVWAAGGPHVKDSQSGFRLYPLPEVLELNIKAKRYQFEVEILVKARQHGIEIREVPVEVIYQKKGVRISHFQPWLDFRRNATTFSRLIFCRVLRIFRP